MNTKIPLISKETFESFCNYLAKNMGLNISKDSQAEMELKIAAIIHAFGGDKDPEECLVRIIESPTTEGIIAKLAKVLSVGETYFFRDSGFFTLLEQQILPQIIKKKQSSRQINIWSAACATGEEPYSIAILLCRLLPDVADWNITILATDINKHFLEHAEQGIYKKWSFRTTPADIQSTYFQKINDNHWMLKPEIRSMVKLQYANLVDSDEGLPGTNERHTHKRTLHKNHLIESFDLIVCHNVLIYFTPEKIAHAIHCLASKLAEDAWLSVTAIEVPYINDPLLVPCYFKNIVLFKKLNPLSLSSSIPLPNFSLPVFHDDPLFSLNESAPINTEILPPSFDPKEFQSPPPQAVPLTTKAEDKDSAYSDLEKLYQAHQYPQIAEKIELLLAYCKADGLLSKQHLQESYLLIMAYANQKQLDKALYWCQKHIESTPLDPRIYYLQATILQELKRVDDAIASLKKALFLDSDFIMAHFELGSLLLQKKRMKEGQKYLRNALTLLEAYPPDASLPHTDGILARHLKDIILNKKL